jgi:hypothetical protein
LLSILPRRRGGRGEKENIANVERQFTWFENTLGIEGNEMDIYNTFTKPAEAHYTDLEQALYDLYTRINMMQGLSADEARQLSKGMLDKVIRDSKQDGTYDLPPNMGDLILNNGLTEHSVANILIISMREHLPSLKDEGVTNEDIRWWWNLHDLERRLIIGYDQVYRLTVLEYEIDQHQEVDEEEAIQIAIERVRKLFPIYGNPEDEEELRGDDRPLPHELKNRINRYTQRRIEQDPDLYKDDIESRPSMNALIREAIRNGEL